jgi:DNA-binding LytR/AlgR family response regulator
MNYEIVGIAFDHDEVIQLIESKSPNLILLDINLNCSMSGIEIAHIINKKYAIPFIYITSYSDVLTLERAKATNPINYIVKPFKEEQLFSTLQLSLSKFSIHKDETDKALLENDTLIIKEALFIKDKFNYQKLEIEDILWVKSDGNYLEIQTSSKRKLVRATLQGFLENLDENFLRVHKSYVVNIKHLTKIDSNYIYITSNKIPVSKSYREVLLSKFKII